MKRIIRQNSTMRENMAWLAGLSQLERLRAIRGLGHEKISMLVGYTISLQTEIDMLRAIVLDQDGAPVKSPRSEVQKGEHLAFTDAIPWNRNVKQ